MAAAVRDRYDVFPTHRGGTSAVKTRESLSVVWLVVLCVVVWLCVRSRVKSGAVAPTQICGRWYYCRVLGPVEIETRIQPGRAGGWRWVCGEMVGVLVVWLGGEVGRREEGGRNKNFALDEVAPVYVQIYRERQGDREMDRVR